MAAFTELDWNRFDVSAIVDSKGIISIDERRRNKCLGWLNRNGYEVESIDCSLGLTHAIPELGRMLNWQQQFGYTLTADNRNLNALRDGFKFNVPKDGGKVFKLNRADMAWQEDAWWLLGLLRIAEELSRRQLALGRRFFTLLVLPENSLLAGQVYETNKVPIPFWDPCQAIHEFDAD